jgi:hypothetical protein
MKRIKIDKPLYIARPVGGIFRFLRQSELSETKRTASISSSEKDPENAFGYMILLTKKIGRQISAS